MMAVAPAMQEMRNPGSAETIVSSYLVVGNAILSVPEAVGRSIYCKEHHMLDILMLILGFGLFAASLGYAYGCERL
jgi:hypothetical protein